jgi:hypothetical protein
MLRTNLLRRGNGVAGRNTNRHRAPLDLCHFLWHEFSDRLLDYMELHGNLWDIHIIPQTKLLSSPSTGELCPLDFVGRVECMDVRCSLFVAMHACGFTDLGRLGFHWYMCASGRMQTDWDSLGEHMPLRLEPYIRQVEPTQAMPRPSFRPRRA